MPRFSTVSSRCSPLPLGSKPAISSTQEILGRRSRMRRALQHRLRHARAAASDRCSLTRARSRHDRLRRDALAAAGEAELLAGRGLDADRVDRRRRDRRRAVARIAVGMRGDLGTLADHGDVGVAEPPAALARPAPRNGAGRRGCRRPSSADRSAGNACRCRPARARRASRRTAHGSPRRRRSARRTPRSCGTRTPPSMTWSPSPKAWTSKPWPMRMFIDTIRAHPRIAPLGRDGFVTGKASRSRSAPQRRDSRYSNQRQVRRRGDLEVVLARLRPAADGAPAAPSPSPRR